MRPVAHRRAVGLLAAAEPDRGGFLGLVLLGHEARPLMGTVAEGLLLAAPAGAPEIVPPGLHIDLIGRFLRHHSLFHHTLPSPPGLCYCPGSRTLVNAPPPHKARSMTTTPPENQAPETLPPRSPPLHILLAAPRGFCAGVDRAVQIVEQALARYGAPVYVRHEIVHNRYVVEGLEKRGAIFV